MPKTLRPIDLPPQPPILRLSDYPSSVRATILAAITCDVRSWRHEGRHPRGVPWWVETIRWYFTAQEIMLATGLTRKMYCELHDSGAMPGATMAKTDPRQSKPQPVVDRVEYVRASLLDGPSWLHLEVPVPEYVSTSELPELKPTFETPHRLLVSYDDFKRALDGTLVVPRWVRIVDTIADDNTWGMITYDADGRVLYFGIGEFSQNDAKRLDD